MEHYILKKYESNVKASTNIRQGYVRFNRRERIAMYICLAGMCIADVFLCLTIFSNLSKVWMIAGLLLNIITIFCINMIDCIDQKDHIDDYITSYKQQLKILDQTLKNVFQISSKEKIQDLIHMYHEYLERKNKKDQCTIKVIFVIGSVTSGFIKYIFEKQTLIEISFGELIGIILLLITLVGSICIILYFLTKCDPRREKYKLMEKKLTDLLLMKY